MIKEKIFNYYVFLGEKIGQIKEVVDNNGKKIYSKKYSGYIMNGSSQPILYEGYIQWASSVYRDKKNNYAMMMYQIPANY